MECKSCHEKLGTPRMARAVFTVIPASGVSGLLCALLNDWVRDSIFHRHTDSIGPDGLIFAIPFLALFSWLFWQIPRWRMRSRYGQIPCPHCGASDWARPRYSGFGF
jgi:hypothetical protein